MRLKQGNQRVVLLVATCLLTAPAASLSCRCSSRAMWHISSGHAPPPTPTLHVQPMLPLPLLLLVMLLLLLPRPQPPQLAGSMPAAAAATRSIGSGTQMRAAQMDALLAAAAGMAIPHLHTGHVPATRKHPRTAAKST